MTTAKLLPWIKKVKSIYEEMNPHFFIDTFSIMYFIFISLSHKEARKTRKKKRKSKNIKIYRKKEKCKCEKILKI